MDLSEFKPPVRLSMSDEEIYQALGSAQASEDGLAKAMAIVEEQANLREHDNKLFGEWVGRMQASTAPEAKIALENIERAKQGLDPLPLTQPLPDVAAALNAAYAVEEQIADESEAAAAAEQDEEPLTSIFANVEAVEAVEDLPEVTDLVVETVVETVVEEVVELEPDVVSSTNLQNDFDQLLADAANEATTSIAVNVPAIDSAVTFESDEPEISNFEVSADEDALVAEEKQRNVVKSGWWANAAHWTLTSGVFVPVVASFLVTSAGFSFGSAVLGFVAGLLLNLGLLISAHFTAQRTAEPNVVASRATFGVFGAFLPGIFSLAFAIVLINLVSVGSTNSFDGVFETGFNFGDELFAGITVSTAIQIGLVVVAFIFAGFARRAVRWISVSAASLLIGAFVAGAVLTRDQLSFDSVDMSVELSSASLVAGSMMILGFASYGKAPKVTPSGSASRTILRWLAVLVATVLIPLAAFMHFVLVFKVASPSSGFELLAPLGLTDLPMLASAVLWVVALAIVALVINLGHSALEQLRAFGINQIRGWFAIIASLTATSLWVLPEWATWLQLAQLLLIPVATGVGFGVAESLIRRGKYHEASLLRSYGFYGQFNLFAILGFAVTVAFGLAIAEPTTLAPWLGFADWTTPFAPLVSFALASIWVAATGIPRILMQQREVAEVELRKASLTEFSGFSE